jgi:hypothetical protein
LLLAKGCQQICLPKGEHYSLGVSEKAIGDRNTRAVMADATIPPLYWDIVVQHVALLNACTSPSICDPSISIFEADKGFDLLENTFGAVILVKQSLVVEKHNVALWKVCFPSKKRNPSSHTGNNHTKRSLTIHLHAHLTSILSTCHPMMTKLKTF